MSDVVVVSEGYVTSETENEEIPESLTTVEEIVKFWSRRKKVYKVRFKRTLPKWLEDDNEENEKPTDNVNCSSGTDQNNKTPIENKTDFVDGNCSKYQGPSETKRRKGT